MYKALAFVAILLCGCGATPIRQYSAGQSAHVRVVMEQCAVIIKSLTFITTDAERDWHYSQCLIQNGAVI